MGNFRHPNVKRSWFACSSDDLQPIDEPERHDFEERRFETLEGSAMRA
jgi:hypothetical protein